MGYLAKIIQVYNGEVPGPGSYDYNKEKSHNELPKWRYPLSYNQPQEKIIAWKLLRKSIFYPRTRCILTRAIKTYKIKITNKKQLRQGR